MKKLLPVLLFASVGPRFLACVSFFLILQSVSAAVWSSDGSAANVQFLHDNYAQDGDTITLPSGQFTWSTTITLTKAIRLQGSGIGLSIIRNNRTVGPNLELMSWVLKAGLPSRMTGIEFQQTSAIENQTGIIRVYGAGSLDGRTIRIDHCKFNNLFGVMIYFESAIGVADHNTFTTNYTGIGIFVKHNVWGGGSNNFGDGSWADLPYFGTNKFIFFEDNTFNNNSGVQTGGNIDSFGGGRYVARHNVFNNALANTHGTESGGRQRSVRVIEIYNNAFNFTFAATAGMIRGGTAVIHDNTYSTNVQSGMTLDQLRLHQYYNIWGMANGSNVWDRNSGGQVVTVLDEPGRGKGDRLANNPPINTVFGVAQWPRNALEPIYSWNNNKNLVSQASTVIEGRDFFNNTSMPGYTPYVYPHPLVSGEPTPTPTPTATATPTAAPTPAAPTALRPTNVTASSFTANWSRVSGATGYRLDVSTSSTFVSYVWGYQNRDVGNVTSQNVTGLAANTFYYYRVRTYNGNGTSRNSNVIKAKTKNR